MLKISPSNVGYFNTICSHVSGTRDKNGVLSVHHFGSELNILTTIWWFAEWSLLTLVDPLTFPLAPAADQVFHVSGEISHYLLYGLPQNLVQTFMDPRRWILMTFFCSRAARLTLVALCELSWQLLDGLWWNLVQILPSLPLLFI